MHYCACDAVFWARSRALNRSLRSLSLRGSGMLPIGRLPEPLRSRRPRPANDSARWLGIPRHHCAVSRAAGSRSGGPCCSHRSHPGQPALASSGEARYGFRCTESSCPGLAGGGANRSEVALAKSVPDLPVANRDVSTSISARTGALRPSQFPTPVSWRAPRPSA